jgi:putative membrane protein
LIVRKRPSAWRLFFIVRGSIVPKTAPQILATMLFASLVVYSHGEFLRKDLTFTAVPFTILGLALSIFLGFRNSAAYDRYWEGRRLWGEVLVSCRILSRQVATLIAPGQISDELSGLRRRMVYKGAAFAHALRHHLRGTAPDDDVRPLLSDEDFKTVLCSINPPHAILRSLSRDLEQCLSLKLIQALLAASLDSTLASLDRVLAGCERIRSTPIPFSYTLLLHRTAYLYCFLLPFGLIDTVGLATPLVVGLVSYTFFGLDALGDEIEEPFGTQPNDLPLSALSRTVEINLRESLGEVDLPPPLGPQNYALE